MKDIIAPEHIIDNCVAEVEADAVYNHLLKKYGGDYSYVYKIVCDCKNTNFLVYKDNHPTIIAECSNCKKKYTIYELSKYPAAVKLNKQFEMNAVFSNPYELYVNYEYSDEYLYEEDVDFDFNNITWARVFIKKDNEIITILDDETA